VTPSAATITAAALRLAAAIAWLAASATAQTEGASKPNIILIMADDVGAECFSWHGGTTYSTPNLERMARQGMRFTRCHSQPVCTPSRVKIMTGVSNVRNYVAFGVLAPGEWTFGHGLKAQGYRTAVVGKWQLYGASHYPETLQGAGTAPEQAGFDRYCLWQIAGLGSRYWKPKIEIDGEVMKGQPDEYGPDASCDYLLRFIEENKDEPFLAYYPMALPHFPFVGPPGSTEEQKSTKSPDNFAAMVTYMDSIVGRILDKVNELGIERRTLVMFTADNGTDRRIESQRRGEAVVGGKNTTTDAGTHVPMLAYWPGTVAAGSACEDLVDFSDFAPTMLEVAGAPSSGGERLDGRSFLPQLRGQRGAPREWLYCWFHPRPITRPESTARRFARGKRFKLYGNGELYDLDADPLEQRQLPDDQADPSAAAARQALQEVLDSMPSESTRIGKPGEDAGPNDR